MLEEISSFCDIMDIIVPSMDYIFVPRGRSRRRNQELTNLCHFQAELFYTIIDWQLQELNSRFSEANSELLLCMGCLNPSDSFSAFNKEKFIRLAQLYAQSFLQ